MDSAAAYTHLRHGLGPANVAKYNRLALAHGNLISHASVIEAGLRRQKGHGNGRVDRFPRVYVRSLLVLPAVAPPIGPGMSPLACLARWLLACFATSGQAFFVRTQTCHDSETQSTTFLVISRVTQRRLARKSKFRSVVAWLLARKNASPKLLS